MFSSPITCSGGSIYTPPTPFSTCLCILPVIAPTCYSICRFSIICHPSRKGYPRFVAMAKPTKPETLSCLIFSNVFLGDGGQDPDKTSQNFQKWTAFLKGDHDVPISSVTSHNFEADIFWYEQSASYSECDLCDVRGQIALSSSDGGPRFKIRPFSGMINK